jgi:hypothetical protein
MITVSPSTNAELLSPDEQDRLDAALRLLYFSEDWVTAPRRADSGAALGQETQRQVLNLLRQGMDEAEIREAALNALAAEENRIKRQYWTHGLIAVLGCISIAVLGALTWQGRGDGHHLMNVFLLGAIGLMVAHALNSRGVRIRSRMLKSAEARKRIWRQAIAAL